MTGKIFNIQRFSTSDGPGIRTTVFFKGCPLSCLWCHNPESHTAKCEIFYDAKKCIGCRLCEKACPNICHKFGEGGHVFVRENCEKCGECAKVCPAKSLEICGEEMSTEKVIETVMRDLPFYEQSGGGLTLSGGEPLAQFDFALELLKKAKENGISTAVETSGFCRRDLADMAKYVDLWLFDIKLFDKDEHEKYTGVSNELIFENLRRLDGFGAKIILRCPIIPDINLKRAHFEKIAELANSLENVIAVNLEPYHPLGISKSNLLGKNPKFENEIFLHKEELLRFADIISAVSDVKVEIE